MRRELGTELHQIQTEMWPDFAESLKKEGLEFIVE